MKYLLSLFGAALLFTASNVSAVIIGFDGITGGANNFQFISSGTYSEAGFTISSVGSTQMFGAGSGATAVDFSLPSDAIFFQNGERQFELSGTGSFSIQSFDLSHLFNINSDTGTGTIELTANLTGGGILTESFSFEEDNIQTYLLQSTWSALDSVVFDFGLGASLQDRNQNFMMLDNITLNEVPEPSTLALLGLGFIGLGFYRRRKLQA